MHLQAKNAALLETGDVMQTTDGDPVTTTLAALVGRKHAAQAVRRLGSNGLAHFDAATIASAADLPPELAERVVAARDFGDALVRPSGLYATDAIRLLSALPRGFARFEREVLFAIVLTAQLQVKAVVVLASGGLTGTTVRARDVFVPLVRHAAGAFALAHNHPSGNPTPSPEDVELTNVLARVGEFMGIPLVDHLVVAAEGAVSMAEKDLLPSDSELEEGALDKEVAS